MNFVSYYYEGALNSGDDTKLPGVTNMPEVHGAIQKDLQQAGEMTCQELYEVQQSAVLHLGRNSPRHLHMLRTKQLGSSFEKELGDPLGLQAEHEWYIRSVNGTLEVLPVSQGK